MYERDACRAIDGLEFVELWADFLSHDNLQHKIKNLIKQDSKLV